MDGTAGPWQWLKTKLAEATIQAVVAVMVAALLPALAIFIPKIGPYLTASLPIPVWLLLSTCFVVVVLIASLARRTRRAQLQAPTNTAPPAAPAPEPPTQPKPDFYPFSYLDLRWEIRRRFFELFRTLENPIASTLDDILKGPFCPQCQRPLRRAEGEFGGLFHRIENPCPTCNRSHPNQRVMQFSLYQIKSEVYKEAQRRARSGEFTQITVHNCPCPTSSNANP